MTRARDLRRLVDVIGENEPHGCWGERVSPARDPERKLRQHEALDVSAEIITEIVASQEG